MSLGNLTELELLQGLFSFIFVVISIFVGIKLILRYFSLKQKEYIAIGLTWIFMTSGWWRACLNFLSFLIFEKDSGIGIYIDVLFIQIAIFCWMYAFGRIIYPNSAKKISIVSLLILIPLEILLLLLLIINPNLIGTPATSFNNNYTIFYSIIIGCIILTALITGIIFALKSIAFEDPKIKWRGRFLLIAFISFTLGAFIDAVFPINAITLLIARTLIISSAIEYYLGFLMPKKLSALLIKNKL